MNLGQKPNEYTLRKQCLAHLENLHGDRLVEMEQYLKIAASASRPILNRCLAFLENALMVAQLNQPKKGFGDKYD